MDRDYNLYVLGGTRFSFFFSPSARVSIGGQKLLFTHCFVLFMHFSAIFSLKMGPMILFTHLKIILLQCFQFSVFSNNKFNYVSVWIEINAAFSFPRFPLFFFPLCVNSNLTWVTVHALFIYCLRIKKY